MASMEVLAAVATAKEEDLKRATEEPSEATPSPEVKCEGTTATFFARLES